MARKPRVDLFNGFYHILILARGNRRGTIFHDDVDYRAYLDGYRQHDGVTLHVYE